MTLLCIGLESKNLEQCVLGVNMLIDCSHCITTMDMNPSEISNPAVPHGRTHVHCGIDGQFKSIDSLTNSLRVRDEILLNSI